MFLVYLPLAFLPYAQAATLWSLAIIVVYAWVVRATWRASRDVLPDGTFVAIAAAAFPPFWSLVLHGHNTIVPLVGLFLGWRALARDRRFLAGFAFGLLFFKPQFGLVLAVFVLCGRSGPCSEGWPLPRPFSWPRWRLAFGLPVVLDYARFMQAMAPVEFLIEPKPFELHSIRALTRFAPDWLGTILWLGASVVVVERAWRFWRRVDRRGRTGGCAGAGDGAREPSPVRVRRDGAGAHVSPRRRVGGTRSGWTNAGGAVLAARVRIVRGVSAALRAYLLRPGVRAADDLAARHPRQGGVGESGAGSRANPHHARKSSNAASVPETVLNCFLRWSYTSGETMMNRRPLEIRANVEEHYSGHPDARSARRAGRARQPRRRSQSRHARPHRSPGTARRATRRRSLFSIRPRTSAGPTSTCSRARDGAFLGSEIPADLTRQWIQGTGPAARPNTPVEKSIRNAAYALLSGADGWMFDGEDALGQLSTMALDNQRNLKLAIHRDPMFMKVAEEVAVGDESVGDRLFRPAHDRRLAPAARFHDEDLPPSRAASGRPQSAARRRRRLLGVDRRHHALRRQQPSPHARQRLVDRALSAEDPDGGGGRALARHPGRARSAAQPDRRDDQDVRARRTDRSVLPADGDPRRARHRASSASTPGGGTTSTACRTRWRGTNRSSIPTSTPSR